MEAFEAHQLLELGVSLTEQGHADESGEVPILLQEWLRAVNGVVTTARAELRAKAIAEAANKTG